jgi:hypothetical protein
MTAMLFRTNPFSRNYRPLLAAACSSLPCRYAKKTRKQVEISKVVPLAEEKHQVVATDQKS